MSEGGEGRTEIVRFEVVPKNSKRRTFTDIRWERVPGGGSRNTKSTYIKAVKDYGAERVSSNKYKYIHV